MYNVQLYAVHCVVGCAGGAGNVSVNANARTAERTSIVLFFTTAHPFPVRFVYEIPDVLSVVAANIRQPSPTSQ
jgi:hypothetical protein